MSDKAFKAVMAILAILAIIALLIVHHVTVTELKRIYRPHIDETSGIAQYNGFRSWEEYEQTKRLHHFHGVLSSEKEEDGSWVFYRNGEKCKLWDPRGKRVR